LLEDPPVCYLADVRWTPERLSEDAEGRLVQRGDRPIAGAFIDSRAPVQDGLFVPIIAARDGHAFIGAAASGGASAVLVQADRAEAISFPEGITVVEVDDTLRALTRLAARCRDRFDGPVIAITGSNGKTTTRAMIAAVAESAHGEVLCTRGNLNNHLGVPLTILGEPHTPDVMVLELGMSAPGENDHLASFVRPTVHVVTSIALEHLEFMGSIEAIAAAEAEPIRHVSPKGAVVVPGDEPLLEPHLPGTDGPTVVRFGVDERAHVRVLDVRTGERTTARIRLRAGEEVDVRLRLFGAHNARNAACALAVGEHLGFAVAPMVDALEQVEPVGDRGRVLRLGAHLVVADCYNANPGSVEVALRSLAGLRAQREGPLLAVLGDMLELGPREAELHAEVGRLAAELGLDGLVGLGPRTVATVDAAREGGIAAHHVGDDPAAAAAWVRQRLATASPGAVLVKASRGIRLERVIDLLLAP
jgi:UDP-N-acetylmuramoyl-tripeptide--D-alanyl-D-alanine ligase